MGNSYHATKNQGMCMLGTDQLPWSRIRGDPAWPSRHPSKTWGQGILCKEPFEDHWCSVCPYFSEGETKTNKDQMLHLKSYSQILLRWNQFSDPQDSTFPHTRLLSTSKPPAGSLQQNFLSISGNQSRPGWIWATQGHLSLSASHQAMPTPGVWSLTLMVS